jgi:2-dehydro-3-deoxyphosphogluconate aldolase/(4S)-4-hydroxy-2-oxoglutarate aldolase
MADQDAMSMIARYRVVPVIAIESVEAALPLADALISGGLPIAEITFRTKAAADVIAKLSAERPDLLVGAGTVLSVENLDAAAECGAKFVVAPGLNPRVVNRAQEIGIPMAPGVCTPTDIESGLGLGCTTLKFFPAGALGGPPMLKALAGPYAHTGVKFIPTGGVNADNLESYLSLDVVAAVGGTWVAKKSDLTAGMWAEIEERCKTVGEIVARLV